MGLGLTIIAGIVLGILAGLFVGIVIKFIKTMLENRKVFKLAPNIAQEILDEKNKLQEVKNVRFKKEETGREFGRGRTNRGTPKAKQTTVSRRSENSDGSGQRGISLSSSGLTLRD